MQIQDHHVRRAPLHRFEAESARARDFDLVRRRERLAHLLRDQSRVVVDEQQVGHVFANHGHVTRKQRKTADRSARSVQMSRGPRALLRWPLVSHADSLRATPASGELRIGCILASNVTHKSGMVRHVLGVHGPSLSDTVRGVESLIRSKLCCAASAGHAFETP